MKAVGEILTFNFFFLKEKQKQKPNPNLSIGPEGKDNYLQTYTWRW